MTKAEAQEVLDLIFDSYEILGLVKTTPETAQPLRVAYQKTEQAVDKLSRLIEAK